MNVLSRREFLSAVGVTAAAGAGAAAGFLHINPVLDSARAEAAGKPITIAHLAPLTGIGAPVGRESLAAFEMTIDEFNQAGGILGRPIVAVSRDDMVSPEVGAREARNLFFEQGVDFIVGNNYSHVSLAISEVAYEARKIYIGCYHGGAGFKILRQHQFHFRVMPSAEVQQAGLGALYAKWKAEGKPVKRFATIAADNVIGHTQYEYLLPTIKKSFPDAQVVAESWHKQGEVDMGPHITKVMAAKPDYLWAWEYGGDITTFLKQAKQLGVFERTPVVLFYEIESLRPLGQTAPEGWYGVAALPLTTELPMAKAWMERVHKKSGYWPSQGYRMYLGLQFLKAAIEKARGTDSEKVADAMRGIVLPSEVTLTKWPAKMLGMGQADNQNFVGLVKWVPSSGYDFPLLTDVVYESAERFYPPAESFRREWRK